jgi:polygalacturonase
MDPSDKKHVSGAMAGVHDVTRFGAIADGRTPCTEALQRALDACGNGGGGTVFVPPGVYATGALQLRSRTHLHLAPGATLLASQRPEDFPPIRGRDEGIERNVHSSLLTGIDLEDVSITGPGLLDGQGESWWRADEVTRKLRVDRKMPREAEHPEDAPLRWPRPRVINLIRCRNVVIDGLTIKDGPCWNVHLVYCDGVIVERLTTYQKRDARGTDGVVVDSSKRVRIAHCALGSGSDCVAIKSGYNEDGRRVGIPSEDILISHCHMYHTTASGVAIGSETTGGVRNVVVSDCVIEDGLSGIFVRAPRGRGGLVENLRFTNIVMDRIVEQGIKITHFFDSIRMEGRFGFKPTFARSNVETARSRRAPIDEGTPTFRQFEFSGIRIKQARDVAVVEGLPERYIRGVTFDGFSVSKAKTGFSCALVAEVTISNCTMGTLETPAVDAREAERLEIYRLKVARPQPAVPAVWLETVTGAFIHGCDVVDAGPGFAWMRQDQSSGVTLAANHAPVERKL